MGKLANASIIVMFLFILGAGASLPTVSADILYYYKGPDFSPDQRFMLSDFRVEGPSNPRVGDTLTVTFALTCQMPTTLGSKGIFAAVRDADNSNRDFGTTRPGESLKAGDVITLSSSLVVDESGIWKIWPSYQVNNTGQPIIYGPDYWHSANITVAAPLLPDLVVLDIVADPANSRVGFTVANQGNATAPSSFSVRLLVSQQSFFETVPQGLAPGAQHSSWFSGYSWPENTNITATVTADFNGAVAELNEGNNARTEQLMRQAEVLRITQGPTVTVVDQDTVVIQWQTNLNSNSSVVYGTTALLGKSQGNSTSAKSHYVTLDKLLPGTTYSFSASSWDSLGQRAVSRKLTFETPPPSDGKAPSLLVPLEGNLSGLVDVMAQAEDEGGVDRLLFYLDGVLRFTDYSPPYIWRLNTTERPNGPCNITVLAIDKAGNRVGRTIASFIDNPEGDTRPPVVSIISPKGGENVWGSVRIEAIALDAGLFGEETGHIQEMQLLIDGVVARSWVYVPFRFDPLTGKIEVDSPRSSVSMLHFWQTASLAPGSNHTLEVRAWDDSGNMGAATANVSITRLEAYLPPMGLYSLGYEFSRSVVRHGNWFEVTLTVRNTGTVPLGGLELTERSRGFQIVSLPMPATSPDEVEYSPRFKESTISFAYPASELPAGGTWTVSYYAVPILYEPIEGFSETMYQIGHWALVHVRTPYIMDEYETSYVPALLDRDANAVNDLEDAFGAADYLLVTNPQRLFDLNPRDTGGVNLLLQDTATLAKAKNGVLGYISNSSAADLKALVSPAGAWSARLGPTFRSPSSGNAFLLLIGKSEVVPSVSYNIAGWGVTWNGGGSTTRVRFSDNYYGDVKHDDGRPELVVGRIVGNTARDLIRPIEASLEVYMGHGTARNKALTISGYEDGDWDVFVSDMIDAGEDLEARGFTYRAVHFTTLVENAWTVHFDEDDVFVLADVDGDGLDEAVVGRDEEDMAYIYECTPRSLVGSFACPITPNDGFTSGDYDGDGRDEIVVAHNGDGQGGRLYFYEANGTMIGYWDEPFDDWDCIGSGDLYNRYGESGARDEVVIGYRDWDEIYAYSLYYDTSSSQWRLQEEHFGLGIDLTNYDAMAVGNLRRDLNGDEVAVARDDNSRIYIYDVFGVYGIDGTNRYTLSGDLDGNGNDDVRFTKHDGFAAGDVNEDREDELVVLCDEDNKMYAYHWNGTGWQWYLLYSKFWDDWFYGVYATGGPDRDDGFGIGRFNLTEPALMVVLKNGYGDTSSFQAFAASWPEAEEWANERIQLPTRDISIMVVAGHGNPWGASPVGVSYKDYFNFTNYPIVFAYSCLAGQYLSTSDLTFSDALFAKGAAAFVGSTEVSECGINHRTEIIFFQSEWDIGSEYPAVALRDYKRDIWGGDVYQSLWVLEYNFYGDPKFGG